jgi:hypothetical protein
MNKPLLLAARSARTAHYAPVRIYPRAVPLPEDQEQARQILSRRRVGVVRSGVVSLLTAVIAVFLFRWWLAALYLLFDALTFGDRVRRYRRMVASFHAAGF